MQTLLQSHPNQTAWRVCTVLSGVLRSAGEQHQTRQSQGRRDVGNDCQIQGRTNPRTGLGIYKG